MRRLGREQFEGGIVRLELLEPHWDVKCLCWRGYANYILAFFCRLKFMSGLPSMKADSLTRLCLFFTGIQKPVQVHLPRVSHFSTGLAVSLRLFSSNAKSIWFDWCDNLTLWGYNIKLSSHISSSGAKSATFLCYTTHTHLPNLFSYTSAVDVLSLLARLTRSCEKVKARALGDSSAREPSDSGHAAEFKFNQGDCLASPHNYRESFSCKSSISLKVVQASLI